MKKTALALSIGATLSFGVQANIAITEYVEGGGNNKAIELYNASSQAVDLSGFTLVRYKDGATDSLKMVDLSGTTLDAKSVLVVRNNATDTPLANSIHTLTNSNLQHNGGDAVGLLSNDVLIDVVGDVPTTKGWGKDKTYRRIGTAAATVYNESDWTQLDKNDISGLGAVGNGGVEPEPDLPTPATIMEIQGASWASPYTDPANNKLISEDIFLVEGVITAIQSTDLKGDLPVGFFMQDEHGDGDPNTSDGIFVTGHIEGLKAGDKVSVTAQVKEDYGWTKLEASNVEVMGSGYITPLKMMSLPSDSSFDFTLERHEGMLIAIDAGSEMYVTRSYGFDDGPERNNLVVSNKSINAHPNQSHVPSSKAAVQQRDCNEDKRLVVESFEVAEDGMIPWYPDFAKSNGLGTTDDFIRIGDSVTNLQGVLGYSHSDFRLYVTNKATKDTFVGDARPAKPMMKDEGLRVASFNVLNYFNSPFGGDCNPVSDSESPTGCTNRGAETQEEFVRQSQKIAQAIVAMNADIVGLMEIENNGFGQESAIADLVDKINALIPDKEEHYHYVISSDPQEEFIGTGAIANQMIFKSATVSLDTYRRIESPRQEAPQTTSSDGSRVESGKNYHRDSIVPTFAMTNSDEKITVAVNHFKSKGSTCWEDVAPTAQDGKDNDHQGSCENFRVSAANNLGKALSNIEGHKLIIGDLNSYASEDPVLLLTTLPEGYSVTPARNTLIGNTELDGDTPAAVNSGFGYVNIAQKMHPDAYGYSYRDEVGTLDYVLVSPETVSHVLSVTEWNINAPESPLLSYSNKNTSDIDKHSDIYRSSDHDPAVITLKFEEKTIPPVEEKPTPNTNSSSGGSLGLGALVSFLGLGLFRRKNKQ